MAGAGWASGTRRVTRIWIAAAWVVAAPLAGQPPAQTAADEYTAYELLEPGSAKFRIRYDVSATTPGARFFFNPIRRGAVASDERVLDRMTGRALRFEEVDGATARRDGHPSAEPDLRYLRVELPRPVPDGGEVRILIDKTYYDPASYRLEGRELVFARSLAIKRNAVILPAGYELVGVNQPSQVLTDADGRIRISFINPGPAAVPLEVRARRLAR